VVFLFLRRWELGLKDLKMVIEMFLLRSRKRNLAKERGGGKGQ